MEKADAYRLPAIVKKSRGVTQTEAYLSELCDRTFLKLWSYANPFKAPGDELCDLIAVFGSHVFLFFDRETGSLRGEAANFDLAWSRFHKEAITKQIRKARLAAKHVERARESIFLDARCSVRLPIAFPNGPLQIHKIIVAHGAAEACKRITRSESGSLAVAYTDGPPDVSIPFLVHLDRHDPVHLLDSETVEIILRELDTFADLVAFFTAKEEAIDRHPLLAYCGEEDLLAHYFLHFDAARNCHTIGTPDEKSGVWIAEGTWAAFTSSGPYRRKKTADQTSYLWDRLLQYTAQNALDGKLIGDGKVFTGQSALFEMAKEPRFMRRALADGMISAIRKFPNFKSGQLSRNLSVMPSFTEGTKYVFLQVNLGTEHDEDERRRLRTHMLYVACGVAKNKFSEAQKIVGLAIDAPRLNPKKNSEDFILLDARNWSADDRERFNQLNEPFGFFQSPNLRQRQLTTSNFPPPPPPAPKKVGRNEPCPCGSGLKYKQCHGGHKT